ncbi:MAG: AraC family transcriptional regulator [Agarilytica sp.]
MAHATLEAPEFIGTQEESGFTPKDPAELFDEYMEKAKIPELHGVSQHVIGALVNRIGHSSLDIANIAKDLNLSKRTLQRHLKQQGTSFSEIRDQVRKHYAVDYLLMQNRRVDDIYTALDFSDRTSLTNAFRRWMGLSPSAFRKLFRDYV